METFHVFANNSLNKYLVVHKSIAVNLTDSAPKIVSGVVDIDKRIK